MSVKIRDLPLEDRPRERLINNGAQSLSDIELLALLINTGTSNSSSKELSATLLTYLKDLTNLKDITLKELTNIKGIGISKATTILASIELGKRVLLKCPNIINIKFNNPRVIFEYYKNKLISVKQEHVYAVYLDASKRVIEDKLLFIGTVNQSIIHARDIFKYACILDASSIICIHNHPSGNVIPSNEDLSITSKLVEIGNMFGIPIIDHIIIGKDKYYSLYENGDL